MPITKSSKSKLKSKNSLYVIKDNFYDFWFKFVYLNKQEIERGHENILSKIKRNFDQYVSFKFENYCKEFLENQFYEKYTSFGKWWHKDNEIDIIALNEEKKEILFGECKWQENVDALSIFNKLKEKTKAVDWNSNKRKETFAVFAKSFKTKPQINNLILYELKDIEKMMQK